MYVELLDNLAEAVTVRDVGGELLFANQAAVRQLGFDSVEQLRGRAAVTILDRYVLEDEGGRTLSRDDLPGMRVLGGEQTVVLTTRAVDRATGEERWLHLRSSPMHDADGRLTGEATVTEDITAGKLADSRTKLLAESGRILVSSLDYEQTLRNVVDIAVPSLADYCSVDLLNEREQLLRVAATHRDAGHRDLVEQLASLDDATLAPDHPARRVIGTSTSELYAEVSDQQLAAVARDGHHLELLRRLGARSLMIVPMRVAARTIGVMTLATDVSLRRFDHDDVELAEQLARRVAVAVENARLHTTLTGVAETLQRALLPTPVPDVPGWEIATLYQPTATELRIDVGGDFYEVIAHETGWFVIVGDVTGKGVAAASLTALMRHGARVASRAEPSPEAILNRLDEVCSQQPGGAMATAICLRIDPERVTVSSAGHPPAILVGADGELRELPRADPMLGAFRVPTRHEENVVVPVGELVVVYTDGVIDAQGRTERFGIARLRKLLAEHAGASPAEALDALAAELAAFAPGPIDDDVAVVALRRTSE